MADHQASPVPPAEAVPFRAALAYWLKLGCISFGGPVGQIGLMHQELVERRRWISEPRFLHALNYTMVLPGPEAQQLATYIGWLMHGTKGGIAAGTLFVLPSFLLLCALTWIYLAFGDVLAVQGVLYGVKPAVTAIVVFAAWRIGARTLSSNALRAIALAAFIAIFAFDVPFPVIVAAAAAIGMAGARIAPQQFRAAGHAGPHAAGSGAPALIDDATPRAEHVRFSHVGIVSLLLAGLALWVIPLAVLSGAFGWHETLAQMGWFFTKAALVTFGGAYAVLPYVFQGAVEHHGWLAASQMIDGLALGETTPGPLIMVVAFVGYVGGWTAELFGPDRLALAGVAGAAVATWFTFLPSFLFILVGAPLVEATRHEIRLTAPLTGITAAVAGVVVNLAVFFAWHVLWPRGFDGAFEWAALAIGVAAAIALFRFRAGVVSVILACGAAGGLYGFLVPAALP